MPRPKRLLAATDLSAPARHAAERAALVAADTGATLDLVHVAELALLDRLRRLVADIPAEVGARMLASAHADMRTLAASLRERYGVVAGVHVATGPILPELERHADAIDADLFVLGARGTNVVRHLMLGSTAERLVGRATRPMLVVKREARQPYRSVLVPVDFSRASPSSLALARAIAPGASIVLLHAFDVPYESKLRFAGVDADTIGRYRIAAEREARQRLGALCDAAGLAPGDATPLVLHGDPFRHIVEQEDAGGCDLVAIGKRGESAAGDLLLGSVTREVLTASRCDVLVNA